jgi:protein O-mannosyl-transferase
MLKTGVIIRVRLIIMAGLLALLCTLSWMRSETYLTMISLWQDAVGKSPNKARPHNNLGLALKHEGRLDEATEQFERAIQLEPNDPGALNNLAIIFSGRGRKIEAVALFQKEISAYPKHINARYNLALLYYELGRFPDAEREYAAIVEGWPDTGEADFARQMLQRIRDRKPSK